MNRRDLLDFESTTTNKKRIPPARLGVMFIIFGFCFSILLMRASILVGEYEVIDRSEAISYTGKFKEYLHSTNMRSDSFYIFFSNNKQYVLSMGADSQSVRNIIKSMKNGQELTVILHPKNNIILAISTNEEVIVDFDESQAKIEKEFQYAHLMFWIGLALLIYLVGCCIFIIIKKVKKKRALLK